LEQDEHKKRWQKEEEERIEKNEQYFKGKNDEILASDFNTLHFISNLIFISDSNEYKRHITEKTFTRLKEILQSILVKKPISPEHLTLDSLAKFSPNANRNIDRVYYTACQLNNECQYSLIKDEEYLNYLYLITFRIGLSANVIKGDFENWFEQDADKAINVLKKYIDAVIQNHLPNVASTKSLRDLVARENNLKQVKSIAQFFISDNIDIINSLMKNLLHEYVFMITNPDLDEITQQTKYNEENRLIALAVKVIREDARGAFTKEMAIAIFAVLTNEAGAHSIASVQEISVELRVRIVDFMLNVFNTVESIQFHDGFQSNGDECASYLRDTVIYELTKDELFQLLPTHANDGDIWKNRIFNRINEIEQNESDSLRTAYSVEKAKDFILSRTPLSNKDFFHDVIDKVEALVKKIQANRENDKLNFWDPGKISRSEETCRDVLLQRMKDSYGFDLLIERERYEASNRIDLNIKLRGNPDYEVQIECKKDNNPKILDGIKNQLIPKYLDSKVEYGIYLVFCFENKTNIDELIQKLIKRIPPEYINRIKVICLDLRL
jgi:hypothetical protein